MPGAEWAPSVLHARGNGNPVQSWLWLEASVSQQQRETLPLLALTLRSPHPHPWPPLICPLPPATDFPVLDVSYEWNPAICGLGDSFSQSFRRLCVCRDRACLPHSSADGCAVCVSTFWLLGIMLL